MGPARGTAYQAVTSPGFSIRNEGRVSFDFQRTISRSSKVHCPKRDTIIRTRRYQSTQLLQSPRSKLNLLGENDNICPSLACKTAAISHNRDIRGNRGASRVRDGPPRRSDASVESVNCSARAVCARFAALNLLNALVPAPPPNSHPGVALQRHKATSKDQKS